MRRILGWTERHHWIWSCVGVALLILALSLRSGQLNAGALIGALTPAAFLAIVAIGQNFAVATGGGNIDLSIPSVITLSAFLTVGPIGGSNLWALPGVLLGMGIGMVVGAVNALLIVRLRIPAIIATLATGYVLNTFTLLRNRSLVPNTIAPILREIATDRVYSVPLIAVLALVVTGVAGLTFHRLGYGRMLLATGQNHRAASLAGIPVSRIVSLAFLVSGGLAGAAGVLLSAYSGGAFMDMGSNFLLQSVGAVVVGGSPAFGGRVTVLGTLIGAVFLTLLGTAMQLLGLQAGAQEIVQGAVIVAVLAASGLRSRTSPVRTA